MKPILILLALVALAGCEVRHEPSTTEAGQPTRVLQPEVSDGKVTRYFDTELRVTCYVFDGVKAGGISCIPKSQLGVGAR